jgi:hypothetical protein
MAWYLVKQRDNLIYFTLFEVIQLTWILNANTDETVTFSYDDGNSNTVNTTV